MFWLAAMTYWLVLQCVGGLHASHVLSEPAVACDMVVTWAVLVTVCTSGLLISLSLALSSKELVAPLSPAQKQQLLRVFQLLLRQQVLQQQQVLLRQVLQQQQVLLQRVLQQRVLQLFQRI